jgi:hypothetical protein
MNPYLCTITILNLLPTTVIMKKVLFSLFLTAMALSGCTQKEVIDLPRGTATAEMEAAVDSFVEATKSRPAPPDSIQLHSIMIVKNGKVLLER